ncbi:ketopantoate reductase family protein [Streptomyces sp. NPDC058440]|uniref:ketopantoate reductase family protein n=1 Tax=Streptomyces sp. NPDC058440 TaxID=3346501 RepID=UPI00365EF84F
MTSTAPDATEATSARSAPRPWTVAVLGPGGVGGLLAALLSRAGHRVICLAGDATARSLREGGIQVRSGQFGDFTAKVEADTELREPVDLCVVAVKHTSLDAALDRVPPAMLGADGLVLPLLNGIEHPGTLRRRYGDDRVAAGVIRVESTRVAPGVIEHGSPFTDIDLAGKSTHPLTGLAAVLESAGVRTRVAGPESAVLWAKLAFLAPFALLTTRYDAAIGTVRTGHREELLTLVGEITAVGRAAGAPLDADRTLAMYDTFPAGMKSSMQRDAEAGRALELDAIGGAVLRAAERYGVPAPTAARLVSELAPL